jgi:hypothetical protein
MTNSVSVDTSGSARRSATSTIGQLLGGVSFRKTVVTLFDNLSMITANTA